MIKIPRLHGWVLAATLVAALLLGFRFWPIAIPDFATVRSAWRPSDAYLLDRYGEILDQQRIDYGVRRADWMALEAVSPSLVTAVVSGEDQRFWQHGGVDWLGAGAAARDQLLRHRRRGASTITMQLADLLDSHPRRASAGKAWLLKAHQVRTAWALERHWSKHEILEAYLNLVSFRGEFQGIGATALGLAGKDALSLNLPEGLALAALIPDPAAAPERVAARACARATKSNITVACTEIRNTVDTLLAGPSPADTRIHLAPHVAHALLKTPGERVTTTLDGNIQRLAAESLAHHLDSLTERNVRDGAVLVVDNASGNVLGYVGSGGPRSTAAAVDGVRARRQAGSTLKPFLYGLAVERRFLTAASLLEDSPINLDTATGVYIPQDYDRDFKGRISVRSALGNSLNVPAVRTLVLVGVESFRNLLWELGYHGLTEDGEYYGYSLALGSAEVSLWEQAQAYRALGQGGLLSPLRLQLTEEKPAPRRVLPPDASFIISDILSDRSARVLTFGMDNHLNTPFWSAVKTGTSKDMRDNWCIGFSSEFTVAVWVGNFEGDSMHDVSGITGAAPIWREVMDGLNHRSQSHQPTPPVGVRYAMTRFSPALEPPRREWFLDHTMQPEVRALGSIEEQARIASPANAMIIAIDPDIPITRQRVPLAARGATGHLEFRLDAHILGPADRTFLWNPTRGAHWLALADHTGNTVDQILFTVR